MIQDILVYIVLSATAIYLFNTVKKNIRLKKANSTCGSCCGCGITKKSSCNEQINLHAN